MNTSTPNPIQSTPKRIRHPNRSRYHLRHTLLYALDPTSLRPWLHPHNSAEELPKYKPSFFNKYLDILTASWSEQCTASSITSLSNCRSQWDDPDPRPRWSCRIDDVSQNAQPARTYIKHRNSHDCQGTKWRIHKNDTNLGFLTL